MSRPKDLEHQIFGGSDSELSEEEDHHVLRRSPAPPEDDEESSAGSGDGDEYVQEKRAKEKKPRKARPKDEDREKKVSRKRKRKAPTMQDIQDMDPEQARKAQLDMQIEAILKPRKGMKPRRKKKDAEEEDLDGFADQEVSRLREAMIAAAEEDIASNRLQQPATAKLKMLPQVMDVLRKSALAQSILDNNLLDGVKRWLEPLPDKSLPALNIQNAFFEVMTKMYIDTNSLKESGLGRVVLFYTKCKRVTSNINKIANELVSNWSRPIIKRSASYRDKHVPMAESAVPLRAEKLKAIMGRAAAELGQGRKNAVRIPTSSYGNYKVAPKSDLSVSMKDSVDIEVERRRRNAERMRNLTRNMSSAKGGR